VQSLTNGANSCIRKPQCETKKLPLNNPEGASRRKIWLSLEGNTMSIDWGSGEGMEADDELKVELENLIPFKQRNQDDIGTREFYDRQDRIAREIIDRAR
jgi:hypothetical protein